MGIALLNTRYKMFSISVLHRIEKYANDIIGNYQTGLIRSKSTTDHIFTISQVLEKYYEFGLELHICFVYFKQAYDSIIKELWKAQKEFEVPAKLIKPVKKCNSNNIFKVKFEKKNIDCSREEIITNTVDLIMAAKSMGLEINQNQV